MVRFRFFELLSFAFLNYLERHCLENLLFIRKVNIYKAIENQAQRIALSKEIKVSRVSAF